MVMAQQDKFYYALVRELGMPELMEDERFETMEDRYQNREALLAVLSECFKSRSTQAWIDLLEGKVPVAPVNSLPQALRDPQVDALGLIVEYEHPELGRIRQTGPPFTVSGYDPRFSPGSPIGADTEKILRELGGLTEGEVEELARSNTI
jgi:crotonobetainyl-CoA:carnitine CoA-transferase CaiB-like acyl-CoA transferase